MSIATIDQHLIHYEALGRGHPIVFIHGWLGSWRYWWPSMQQLSRHHRTFAFDLWGFGDSSKVPNKYSFEAYVEMLDQFLDRLGIGQPIALVGHSLGAAIALRFANLHSERVERLVTVALPFRGNYINERLANSDSASFLSKVMNKSNTFPEVERETRKTDTLAMNQVATELASYDFTQEINDCPSPHLIVFGGQDPVIQQPNANYEYLKQPTINRIYLSLESCTHFPMLEETAQFNRLILDFMNADGDLTQLSVKEYWQRRTR